MPSPMYFHPFQDHQHWIGIGPQGLLSPPSSVSLHWVSPTFGKAHYKYLWKMGNNSNTFQNYVANTDRIYVMGHCSPGSLFLETETGTQDTCYDWELARIFERHGLQKASQVHIRIHACDSGGNGSFAQSFKQMMVNRGYNNVTVRGYTTGVGIYLFYRWAGFFQPANNFAVDY